MKLVLPGHSCATCQHFDGENWCSLVLKEKLIPGYIAVPAAVVCAKHEPKERDGD